MADADEDRYTLSGVQEQKNILRLTKPAMEKEYRSVVEQAARKLESMRKENAALRAQNEELKSENIKLDARNQVLTSTNDDLKKEVVRLKEENDGNVKIRCVEDPSREKQAERERGLFMKQIEESHKEAMRELKVQYENQIAMLRETTERTTKLLTDQLKEQVQHLQKSRDSDEKSHVELLEKFKDGLNREIKANKETHAREMKELGTHFEKKIENLTLDHQKTIGPMNNELRNLRSQLEAANKSAGDSGRLRAEIATKDSEIARLNHMVQVTTVERDTALNQYRTHGAEFIKKYNTLVFHARALTHSLIHCSKQFGELLILFNSFKQNVVEIVDRKDEILALQLSCSTAFVENIIDMRMDRKPSVEREFTFFPNSTFDEKTDIDLGDTAGGENLMIQTFYNPAYDQDEAIAQRMEIPKDRNPADTQDEWRVVNLVPMSRGWYEFLASNESRG